VLGIQYNNTVPCTINLRFSVSRSVCSDHSTIILNFGGLNSEERIPSTHCQAFRHPQDLRARDAGGSRAALLDLREKLVETSHNSWSAAQQASKCYSKKRVAETAL
jgi:hypothetical protein